MPKKGKKPAKNKSDQFKKPSRRRRKKKRPCLGGCGRDFMSDGIYNRICPSCRDRNANIAVPEPPEPLPNVEILIRRTKSDDY